MMDLIDRQAAIDAIGGNKAVGDPSQMDEDEVIKMWERIRIINVLNHLPPAQPETHEERTETHECDLTNTQQAIIELFGNSEQLPSAQPEQSWIPCTPDTMPDDLGEVYVTWVNHNPPWYYTEIKDKPFTAPAVYHRGKWYWYSSVCVDTLAEYGKNDVDEVDKDIEIVAWMPLPEPYRGES